MTAVHQIFLTILFVSGEDDKQPESFPGNTSMYIFAHFLHNHSSVYIIVHDMYVNKYMYMYMDMYLFTYFVLFMFTFLFHVKLYMWMYSNMNMSTYFVHVHVKGTVQLNLRGVSSGIN
jgi:hypothetical protein